MAGSYECLANRVFFFCGCVVDNLKRGEWFSQAFPVERPKRRNMEDEHT